MLLDEAIAVPSYSASLSLMRKYSVYLGPEWSAGHTYRLLQTFESIPRLDGLPHRTRGGMPAVAWTGAGYIEFMESAFQETDIAFIHRLVLHEKVHFLWEHLFDEQLKQDWIEVGGWYENPDDKDGWSTTE